MLLEIENITLLYGRIQALHGISLEVEEGEIVALIGANGAGKSTTMRVILGLDAADEGAALVDGQPYRSLRRPLCRVGSLVSFPFSSCTMASCGEAKPKSSRMRRKTPMPSSDTVVTVAPRSAKATLTSTARPPEWSTALLRISVVAYWRLRISSASSGRTRPIPAAIRCQAWFSSSPRRRNRYRRRRSR